MVVQYNKNSNGIKIQKKKCNGNAMSIQTNAHVYYSLITWRSQRNKAYA